MTPPQGRGLLHLAAAVDQEGAPEIGACLELARLTEGGALDFVTLDDPSVRPGPDAVDILTRVATGTDRLGLVPTVRAAHTEPSLARAAVAALDRVSRGRAGWRVAEPTAGSDARHTRGDLAGRPDEGRSDESRVEEGWMDGEEGHPVRVIDATDEAARHTAARYADVALLRVADSARAATLRDELRAAATGFGRAPDALRVLVSLTVDLGGGEYAAEPGWGSP
jgi:alkanesulfonate monooxygenase SsuD/methylene tetrahydromethanopterin reductase-like flavin-dependent oxidoreductase (luciferase family)